MARTIWFSNWNFRFLHVNGTFAKFTLEGFVSQAAQRVHVLAFFQVFIKMPVMINITNNSKVTLLKRDRGTPEKLKINQETLRKSVDLNREFLFLVYFDNKQRYCSCVPPLYLYIQYQSVNQNIWIIITQWNLFCIYSVTVECSWYKFKESCIQFFYVSVVVFSGSQNQVKIWMNAL